MCTIPGALLVLLTVAGCVDPYELSLRSTRKLLGVDGSINTLPETQGLRSGCSVADVLLVKQATVAVIVDSVLLIPAHEIMDRGYHLSSDSRRQIGWITSIRE